MTETQEREQLAARLREIADKISYYSFGWVPQAHRDLETAADILSSPSLVPSPEPRPRRYAGTDEDDEGIEGNCNLIHDPARLVCSLPAGHRGMHRSTGVWGSMQEVIESGEMRDAERAPPSETGSPDLREQIHDEVWRVIVACEKYHRCEGPPADDEAATDRILALDPIAKARSEALEEAAQVNDRLAEESDEFAAKLNQDPQYRAASNWWARAAAHRTAANEIRALSPEETPP